MTLENGKSEADCMRLEASAWAPSKIGCANHTASAFVREVSTCMGTLVESSGWIAVKTLDAHDHEFVVKSRTKESSIVVCDTWEGMVAAAWLLPPPCVLASLDDSKTCR